MPVDVCGLCVKGKMVDICQGGGCQDYSQFSPDPEAEKPGMPMGVMNFRGLSGNGRLALMLFLVARLEHSESEAVAHGSR